MRCVFRRVFGVAVVTACAFGSNAALAQTQRESQLLHKLEVLAARVEFLEGKIKRLEKAGVDIQREQQKNQKSQKNQTRTQSAEETTTTQPSPARSNDAPQEQSVAQRAASAASAAEVPQEAFIFRDLSATLKQGKFEIGQELSYARRVTTFQNDRGGTSITSIRYGIVDGLEAAIILPAYSAIRRTAIGPGITQIDRLTDVGDMTVQLNYQLIAHTEDLPGVSVSLAGILPTGQQPYADLSNYNFSQTPIDPFKPYQSRGHYGIRAGGVAYKLVDPFVYFVAASVEHTFADVVQGYNIAPGLRITIATGFNFAVTDRTTLGMDYRASYQLYTNVNGIRAPLTDQETHIMRILLTQRWGENYFIEPAVAFGLTRDSPDLTVSLGIRYRN